MKGSKVKTETMSVNKITIKTRCTLCLYELTWAEHMLNPVNELFCHKVCKAPHAHNPVVPLACDALQNLILLNLFEHVSNTDGVYVDRRISEDNKTNKNNGEMMFCLP